MRTIDSRQRSRPCWEPSALDEHTLRDIGLTRFDARVRTPRQDAGGSMIRTSFGAGVLLSAVLAGLGLFAA